MNHARMESNIDMIQMMDRFGTEEKCRAVLEELRWLNGICCPRQRGGKVRLQVIDKPDRKTLHAFLKEHTAPDTEVIITDEFPAYKGIGDHDTVHETVNHVQKEWARGDIHTNGIENVWSLLKRSVTGTYHKLSVKHLDAYLDELEWRFNNRDNSYLFRDTLIKLLGSKQLEYQDLVAS